ncbi:MAG: hypothetical protein K9N23_01280 [Akkermansiaceae bacterium]|nr:hypothetical protein [Akkermansiaceae bacterium]
MHEVEDVAAALGGEGAFDGAGLALEGVDALGLGAGFIDCQDETAVEKFFVDVDGGGGEEDGDGSFDVVPKPSRSPSELNSKPPSPPRPTSMLAARR